MRRRNRDWFKEFCAVLGDVKVEFWLCPIPGHSEGTWRTELVQTVEWRGDVAHCLAPGCARTSAYPGKSR